MAEIDYYKTLQDQNYKELLDREIQLDSARQRALRNTNTNLAAAGMDSSGLGALAQSGVENQYLQGLTNAQNKYQEQALSNKVAEFDAMNNQYTGFTQKLSELGFESEEQFNSYLKDRGLLNEDGTYNEEEFAKQFGSHNYNEFVADMNAYKDALTNYQDQTENGGISYNINEALGQIVDNEGKTGTLNDELSFLFGGGKDKIPAKDGTVLMVKQNDTAGAKFTYLIYKNGGWQMTNSATYHNAETDNRYELYSDKNSNKTYNIRHNGNVTKANSKGENKIQENFWKSPKKVYDYFVNGGEGEFEYEGRIYWIDGSGTLYSRSK